MTPGVIFDMDDTLYPERQFIRSGFRAVAAAVRRRYGVPESESWRVLLTALRQGRRVRALQVLCDSCHLPAACIPDLVEVIRGHAPTLRLPVDSAAAIDRLRHNGWRVGVLTNGLPEVQARKVRALGLDARVDAVVYALEWGSGVGKPDREPFEVVLARLGTPPALTVFVGDDPWCDVVGARRAGLRAILLSRRGVPAGLAGAHRVVTAIEDVVEAAAAALYREVADAA